VFDASASAYSAIAGCPPLPPIDSTPVPLQSSFSVALPVMLRVRATISMQVMFAVVPPPKLTF
jgi:hypothetical protein